MSGQSRIAASGWPWFAWIPSRSANARPMQAQPMGIVWRRVFMRRNLLPALRGTVFWQIAEPQLRWKNAGQDRHR